MVTPDHTPNLLTQEQIRRSRRGTLGAFPSDDLYRLEDSCTADGGSGRKLPDLREATAEGEREDGGRD